MTQARELSIGVFGARGSYSEEAALSWAELESVAASVQHFDSFDELLAALEAGRVARACLPVANTTTGIVGPALQALGAHDFEVEGSLFLAVRHALLVRDAAALPHDIDTIASHPQALAQCRRFLDRRFPAARLRPWNDTAQAARDLAAGVLSLSAAVIASPRTASLFGLRVLEHDVQDERDNRTAFLIARSQASAAVPATDDARDRVAALRERIQTIDTRAIELMAARFALVDELSRAKRAAGMALEDPEREARLFAHYAEISKKAGLERRFVERVFTAILEESKRLQRRAQGGA